MQKILVDKTQKMWRLILILNLWYVLPQIVDATDEKGNFDFINFKFFL